MNLGENSDIFDEQCTQNAFKQISERKGHNIRVKVFSERFE